MPHSPKSPFPSLRSFAFAYRDRKQCFHQPRGRVPFGIRNAGAVFQRASHLILHPISRRKHRLVPAQVVPQPANREDMGIIDNRRLRYASRIATTATQTLLGQASRLVRYVYT
jgi:hypothetical protein